ncbi:MAG: two-component regulator propeller domain-containing protein [Salinimicrobium sp.]
MRKGLKIFFIFGLFLFFLSSCHSGKSEEQHDFELVQSLAPPVVVQPGSFPVHYLDSLPPPLTVLLSSRPAPKKEEAGLYFSMSNFNTVDGLAMSSLLCGFRDKDANLWFGTNGNGVSMYNGKSFITFSSAHGLIHNYIHTVKQDRAGNLWFGTYGGVSRYDGTHFFNYTTEDGLIDNDVREIHEDRRGRIWFASTKGISRLDPQKGHFKNYSENDGLANSFIDGILEDRSGRLWFTGNGGIYLYDPVTEASGGKAFRDLSEDLKLKGIAINDILEDTDGLFWIATENFVCRYDPDEAEDSEERIRRFDTRDGLVNNYVFCSTEDRNGNIWFGTKDGVSRYSKTDDAFLNITKAQGLADNQVRNITEDKTGSLWFGTYGGGLNKYDGESVLEYRTAKGSWKAVYAIAEDSKGDLWFSPSDGGIVRFRNARKPGEKCHFWTYTTQQGLPDNTFLSMVEDHDGNLWFGSDKGLCRYDGRKFTVFTTEQGLPDNDIDVLTVDSKGNLWIGTFEGGVSKFDGSSFTNLGIEEGLVHKTVWDILEDKEGKIWIATRGGLSLYDGEKLINFYKEQGLADNKLSRVFQDSRGNLLIGTWGGGLSVIRKDRLQKGDFGRPFKNDIFETFSNSNGLANDVVYTIVEDKDMNIVLGTNLGFTVIKGGIQAGEEIGSSGVENFNEKTGYPIKDVSNNFSMIKDSTGKFWLGTGDKFLRFDYDSVFRDSLPPPLFLQNLRIKNENISWHSLAWARNEEKLPQGASAPAFKTNELLLFNKRLNNKERDTMINSFEKVEFSGVLPFYPVPQNLVLPYSSNDIDFEFVGVETSRPGLVEYQYKLEDYDEAWSPVTKTSFASYGNLLEGDYNFFVKARNPDGVWSEPVQYSLEVLPPWYRSWVAYVFYVLLFLVLLYYVDKYQTRRLLFKERQKAIKRELKHAHDIEKAYSELQSTQAQLIYAEKMASLGEITAGVAHELRNPLNFVTNFSEVSRELLAEVEEELKNGNLTEAKGIMLEVQKNLEMINRHGRRADAIVKGMLQHSRAGSGEKEPVDLNKLVESFVRLVCNGLSNKDRFHQVKVEKHYDRSLKKVEVIPQDLGRVVINLLTNAFHAVEEKTHKMKELPYQPQIWVETENLGDKAEIRIKDNGTGIPQHILAKIFQPFFTTRSSGEGTGLGLSISFDVIKVHGGEIKVSTEEGVGSSFTVILPTAPKNVDAKDGIRENTGKT